MNECLHLRSVSGSAGHPVQRAPSVQTVLVVRMFPGPTTPFAPGPPALFQILPHTIHQVEGVHGCVAVSPARTVRFPILVSPSGRSVPGPLDGHFTPSQHSMGNTNFLLRLRNLSKILFSRIKF